VCVCVCARTTTFEQNDTFGTVIHLDPAWFKFAGQGHRSYFKVNVPFSAKSESVIGKTGDRGLRAEMTTVAEKQT